MPPSAQIPHVVIVEINMDATGGIPKFGVERIILSRDRTPSAARRGGDLDQFPHFECIHCQTSYSILPRVRQVVEYEMNLSKTAAGFMHETSPRSYRCGYKETTTGSGMKTDRSSGFEILEAVSLADQQQQQRAGNRFSVKDMYAEFAQNPHLEDPQDEDMMPLEMSIVKTESEIIPPELRTIDLQPTIQLTRIDEDPPAPSPHQTTNKITPLAPRSSALRARLKMIGADSGVIEMSQNRSSNKTCNICGFKFKTRSRLAYHMPVHSGIRYSCTDCPKSFSRAYDLRRHREKLHMRCIRACKVCRKKRVWTKAELIAHMRTEHPQPKPASHPPPLEQINDSPPDEINDPPPEPANDPLMESTNDPPPESTGDPPQESTSDPLMESVNDAQSEPINEPPPPAMVIKTEPRYENDDFVCNYCDAPAPVFADFEALKEHFSQTHGRRAVCPICPKAYMSRGDLQGHIDVVHLHMEFRCTKCDIKYTWKRSLMKHMKTVHGCTLQGTLSSAE